MNDAIYDSLYGLTGDPIKGKQLIINKNKGNCLACHNLPIQEESFHGTIGPSLNHIASKLTEGQLRLRIVDMKHINPLTIMPGYFKSSEQMFRVASQYQGTTLLTAQEIEDIVAYLVTLKTQHTGLSQ